MNIDILNWNTLKDIPSASGIVKYKSNFYVIGDDSPYLFEINNSFDLVSKTLIYSSDKLKGDTLLKVDKPDFEAMEMVSDTEILVFGSGSKSPERDICILIEIEEKVTYKEYDISLFYDYLRNLQVMESYELDIECLAFKEDLLYLFNRGRNIIFSFCYNDFLNYCKTGENFPIPVINLYSLPKIKGLQAGFSGGTTYGEKSYLLFTASVEDSPNAYEDGDILGSFIGMIEINNNKLSDEYVIQRIPNPDFPLKVESIVVNKFLSKTETELILVTDNDGNPSQILTLRMEVNKGFNTIK